jgi:hypothetical protein
MSPTERKVLPRFISIAISPLSRWAVSREDAGGCSEADADGGSCWGDNDVFGGDAVRLAFVSAGASAGGAGGADEVSVNGVATVIGAGLACAIGAGAAGARRAFVAEFGSAGLSAAVAVTGSDIGTSPTILGCDCCVAANSG